MEVAMQPTGIGDDEAGQLTAGPNVHPVQPLNIILSPYCACTHWAYPVVAKNPLI